MSLTHRHVLGHCFKANANELMFKTAIPNAVIKILAKGLYFFLVFPAFSMRNILRIIRKRTERPFLLQTFVIIEHCEVAVGYNVFITFIHLTEQKTSRKYAGTLKYNFLFVVPEVYKFISPATAHYHQISLLVFLVIYFPKRPDFYFPVSDSTCPLSNKQHSGEKKYVLRELEIRNEENYLKTFISLSVVDPIANKQRI